MFCILRIIANNKIFNQNKMAKVSIEKIADIVVTFCHVQGFTITPLKLQKVLYYIQAWHLVKFDNQDIFDELPQAWVNGPVYRSIYRKYSNSFYRNDIIPLQEKDPEKLLTRQIDELGLSEKEMKFLNVIMKHYASKDEGFLVLKTHSEKPWNKARKGLKPFERSNNKIKAKWMYDYYSEVVKNNNG